MKADLNAQRQFGTLLEICIGWKKINLMQFDLCYLLGAVIK